jgi:hypothetical protein
MVVHTYALSTQEDPSKSEVHQHYSELQASLRYKVRLCLKIEQKQNTDFCLHVYQNLWATGIYTKTVQSTAMQRQGLVILYTEHKANGLFKTPIYLLEGVKVGKAFCLKQS